MAGGLGRARGRLHGPLAIAGLTLLAACGRPAGAVPSPAASATASTPGTPSATPSAQAATGAGEAAPPGAIREVTCTAAPLGVRVISVRRETADSIRVELVLTNLAAAGASSPDLPAGKALQAAVDALDGASVLSADGRRRMFALRDAAGDRVGPPLTAPAPGRPESVWRSFPAAEGQVTLLLPGCAPLDGLTVAPRPGSPEP